MINFCTVRLKLVRLIKRFTLIDWVLILLFVFFLGYVSVSFVTRSQNKRDAVEIFTASNGEGGEVLVDVSGAVVSAGVYKLKTEDRIKDALVAAGGLSAEADRDFLSVQINQAEKLTDGMKIYIPYKRNDKTGETKGSTTSRVNINTASLDELDGLYGVGQTRATQIVANRPYKTVDDLVTKGVLTKGVLDKIRDKVSVY